VTPAIERMLGDDALRAVMRRDRTRVEIYEQDGVVFVGYVPRNPRGPMPSRSERNRMRRFANYVYGVRRLPLPIRCVKRHRPGGDWHVAGGAHLPMQAWRVP
jgi:hypothetical protein